MVRPMLTAEDRERGRRLGALLRAARADRSMGEVAAASGVPVETLRKIETGRIPTPAFFTVAAIAAALDLPLETLAVATAAADTSAADPRSA
jgi:transcriptional regulator with XRE-family HTH domain